MRTPVLHMFVIALWTLICVVTSHISLAAPNSDSYDWTKGVYRSVTQVKAAKQTLKPSIEAAKKQAVTGVLNSFAKTPINSFVSGQDLLKYPKLRALLENVVRTKGQFKSVAARVAGIPIIKMTLEIPAVKLLLPALDFYKKLGMAAANPKSLVMKISRSGEPRIMAEKSLEDDTPSGPFTSLIVDSSGLGLKRAMSPKIRREDGTEVWGTVEVDPDYVLEKGIVSYTTSLDLARRDPRAGDNPLVIQAIGISGGKFMCDPVVSDSDAKKAIDEDAITNFLSKFNVIFVAN